MSLKASVGCDGCGKGYIVDGPTVTADDLRELGLIPIEVRTGLLDPFSGEGVVARGHAHLPRPGFEICLDDAAGYLAKDTLGAKA